MGGYINPKKMLEDKKQLEKLNDAIKTVKSFENTMLDEGLLNGF